MRVFIAPSFNEEDSGDGGIRRIVEAQTKWLPKYGIDIAQSTADADLIAVHAGAPCDLSGIQPLVAHCHGLYWSEYKWEPWAHYLNKLVVESMRIADVVTAPSRWVANAIKRGMWVSPHVIYHGIDAQDWTPGVNKGYVLWNKTRVDAVCDPKPVNELANRAKDTQFISTFGTASKNVTLTGRLSYNDAKEYIQNAGVYLCTSRETFGIGTLEAMACGVPILGWNWGGQAEFIRHKIDGYLCQPNDYDDLLRGLDYCLKNRDTLGQAARESVLTDFTWDKIIQQYAETYESIKQPTTKVSVVIPCYKLAHLLPETVNSVIEQEFDDYEVIIVDDASPDNTMEVAQELAALDPHIKIIHNETNQYLAGALNTGIAAAQGKYIIPLDADNMLGAGALHTLSSALDNDRTVDIAYGSMQLIEPDGKKWISGWPKAFNFQDQLSHKNQCPSTSMYRKRIWERVGGYRRRCLTAEDADFWTRASSYGAKPKKVTGDVTLIYRNRPDSMSRTNKDWAWHKWYPWHIDLSLAPYSAPLQKITCPSYELPTISIIIPVGPGHEHLVIDAVDSVIANTYQKWEVIVVNDTGKPLPWIHPFVKLIETSGSKGPAFCRNLAIGSSKGDAFIPLDADDILHPEALERLYNVWSKYGGYVYSDWTIYESGQTYSAPDYNCDDLIRKLPHAVTALYPKSAWSDSGGFDDTLETWEDWDFVLAINEQGYCGIRVPFPLFSYRMQSGTRREELQQNKESAKEAIRRKWHKYIVEGVKLMACGGCSKGGKVTNTSAIAASAFAPAENSILVEYIKDDGPITYRGPITGTSYRFGVGNKIKSVNVADAKVFLQRPEFRRVSERTLEVAK